MNLTIADREEYYQTAFLALDDAVRAFSEKSQYSFMSYYRMCIKHRYYLYVLEMKYLVRLNATVTDKSNYKYIEKMVETEQADIGELDLSFEQVEYCILADAVWCEVFSSLDYKNAWILQERYLRERTLNSIADELGIGCDRVRRRISRSLNRLRRNQTMKSLAQEYSR